MSNKYSGLLLVMVAASATAWSAEVDPIALRAATQKLEAQMYEVFNGLNSRNDFDVACGERKVTGSTIPVWQCDAAFMREAGANDVARRFDNNPSRDSQFGYAPQSSNQLARSFRRKAQELNEEMMALARQHPELASAMIAYNASREQLAQLEK